MKEDLNTAPYWNIGLIVEGHIVATLKVLGKSAHHAMKRIKRETEGATVCILGGTN